MKVFLIDDVLVNLEQVQYINTIETGRNTTTIWFHFKTTAKSVAAKVSNDKVSEILQKCFELMKKED